MHKLHIALRIFLGILLLTTALGKALDLSGFRNVLVTYQLFPEPLLWPIVVFIPILEFSIALAMLSGKKLGYGIFVSIFLHASFTIILTIELLRGIHLTNCGCFGVFLARPLTFTTPLEDVVLLLITFGIWKTQKK